MSEHFTVRGAPLGGVLLVKVAASHPKDVAAIEQAAKHLPAENIDVPDVEAPYRMSSVARCAES